MASILDKILERKIAEVAQLRVTGVVAGEKRSDARRPFASALRTARGMAVIAEVKKASPSKGVIRADFDPVAIARMYHAAGASAISVLTDRDFFQGSLEYLTAVRAAVPLPVLRKDFVVDPLQISQSAAVNADAVLLIAAALSDTQLRELRAAAAEAGIETLVEVHDAGELERVLAVGVDLVGINNRNLGTFVCDVATTIDLMSRIPPEIAVVSESGIETAAQVQTLRARGVRAVLVGETLMRLADPGPRIREFVDAGAG